MDQIVATVRDGISSIYMDLSDDIADRILEDAT